ncbi:MAG: hypothetical protein BroJett029_26110 [Alphaproteobacteria bacterium]|nr:MAG: hypothetical protein BroJett029_26110 [Alphaproteobacteria bacterium]
MTDLRHVDLSDRPDSELTPEERAELQRRFRDFTQAVKEAALMRPAAPEKPRKITKWMPAALGARRAG